MAAATKSGSVHFQLTGKVGANTETITGDASNTDGREVIDAGQVSIQAEVIGQGAYVEGNSGGAPEPDGPLGH